MGRNTSISLGDHFEEYLIKSIQQGGFKNASEVVEQVELLEEEENKIIYI